MTTKTRENKIKNLDYYMNLNYDIIVNKTEKGGFVAEIPELPGCITYADNFNEVYELINDAKKSWISSRLKRKLSIPEPSGEEEFSGRLSLRIPKSLHKKLYYKSQKENVSLNQLLLNLLSEKSSEIELQKIKNDILDELKILNLHRTQQPVAIFGGPTGFTTIDLPWLDPGQAISASVGLEDLDSNIDKGLQEEKKEYDIARFSNKTANQVSG